MAHIDFLVLSATSVLSPLAGNAQRLGQGGDGIDISIARVLAALLVCLAAAFVLALVVRGRNRPLRLSFKGWLNGAIAGTRRIDVVEARRVSPFADVCLIRCDGVEYLLLCGASGQRVLRRSVLAEGGE